MGYGDWGRFNQSKTRELLQGFWYEIINYIDGERGWSTRDVEEGYVNISFPLKRYQVYAWVSEMDFFPEL